MPETLVAPRASSGTSAASAVLVESLNNQERAVALYASDMPDRYQYRAGDAPTLVTWILQGAERMGLERLYRSAALARGYRLSWLEGRLTPAQKQGQAARFPRAGRLARAEELAAAVTCQRSMGMSDEAKARQERPAFDGPCPTCDDAGKLWGHWAIDPDADWFEEGYRPCGMCQGGVA
ncbi:hypothetical protein [Streptomyces sp. MK37H]|uniref:hypothetical protein n=1 Tax=Streptomyces sp. MK37H TaxID=2699117 RepID=UPI001B358A1F|nr:hypothetical protein [Streptomyces sp. MK37H]MBP8533085.1 hypothetical protein [Streptomyces sp. MK37H]